MITKADNPKCKENKENMTSNFAIRWRRLWFANYSARYIRFKGDLCTYKKHLDTQTASESGGDWIPKAMELCDAAFQKLKEVRIDEGWKLLHEAKRQEVYGNEGFRKATIIQLREEASKLNKWRSDAIYKIVGFNDDKIDSKSISAQELEKALQIRDEFYHTLYYTNRLTRGQYNWLFFILVLLISCIIIYISFESFSSSSKMSKMNVSNLLGILLFGLLGSTTSTIFHFRKSQSTSRIPEIISNNSITMSRIFVGAGFSVFIFIFLNSGMAKAIDIFKFEINTYYEFFTIAFVSGFSERFALNSIQKIIGKKE